ncbi:NUDIX domain-containing protein [Paenibacillus sp. PR3]|uniref:NUDIX domain-containing protein n=1 Tax=Paenibacillus terricola TaxID=2763503 RepID=A0ABR8MQZ7_9BACL|nr:NUDIX domain-containing protein [Paenibacillus terricola]MBD3918416.1 NUDIX domain-containing protein [Paenibacillus terricola]
MGPTKKGTTLGVVRLGGRRENGETGWECASREVFEEASIALTALKPPATYWFESSDQPSLKKIGWQVDDVQPILVGKRKDSRYVTPIYLAYSHDTPRPAAETKGLLLLTPTEIATITSGNLSLGHFLENGGKAIVEHNLPLNLPLEPYPHLRLVHTLLKIHPEIANSVQ